MSGRPDGPAGRFLTGNRYDYELDRLEFLRNCQRRYGDVFAFSPKTTVILDPDLVHEVLARTNSDFGAEADLFDDVPLSMSRTAVQAHGRRVLELLHHTFQPVLGQETDVAAVMKTYSGRVAADLCLGATSADVADAVAEVAEAASRLMTSSPSLPRWLPVPSVRRVRTAEDRLAALVAERIRERRSRPVER